MVEPGVVGGAWDGATVAHPRMYDEDDPLLARVRRICLALPETREQESHGRPSFFAGKRTFAHYGIHGEDDRRLLVRPDDTDHEALLQHPRSSVPPYLGPSGWLGFELQDLPGQPGPDWDELAELVEDSYRRVALVRMRHALDGGRTAGPQRRTGPTGGVHGSM